jgi:ABC-type transport system involved in multi-copper enzyme maturation permease subunit
VRGRSIVVATIIAALPVLFAVLIRRLDSRSGVAGDVLFFEQLVLAVLPPMFIASSIGEEIEDRTITYLWSRPVARWTVIAGKLVALVPVAIALGVAGWYAAFTLALDRAPPRESLAAIAAGALVLSTSTAALAVLAPRHGLALAICYGLADTWVGVVPATVQQLTVSEHVRTLSNVRPTLGEPATAVAWLVGITALWLGIALWRIRRLEA